MSVCIVCVLWRRDAVIRHQMLVRQLIAPLGVSASASVMNTRRRLFCQGGEREYRWRGGNWMSLGGVTAVFFQPLATAVRCDEKQTNQLKTNENDACSSTFSACRIDERWATMLGGIISKQDERNTNNKQLLTTKWNCRKLMVARCVVVSA